VCAGALEVGHAGLLDGRHFTTHWQYRKTILDRHAGERVTLELEYAGHAEKCAD
jgi:transcriptional regulator GlxA family with amidase domain